MPDSSTGSPWALCYVPHLAVSSTGYVLFAYAAVPDVLMARFDVGFPALGLLMSAALFSVVLAQPLSGRLTARATTTEILLVATVAHLLLAVAQDFAQSFWTLLALRVVWGLPTGVILTAGGTHIARLFEGSAATRQQGIYGGTLTLGGALSFLLVPSLSPTIAPFDLYTLGALLGLPAVGVLWQYRNDSSTAPTHEESPSSGSDSALALRDIVTHPVVAVTSLCYVASLGSYVTVSTFVTSYYAELGVSVPVNVLVLVVASVGRATGGAVVRQWSLDDYQLIRAALGVATLGFVLLAITRSLWVIVALTFVVMLGASFPFGAIYHATTDAIVKSGNALAIVIAAGNVAALILPTVTGVIRAMTGGYGGAFLLLGALNAAAVVGVVSLVSDVENPFSI